VGPVSGIIRFNVCLPQPGGYEHSFCLLELSELFARVALRNPMMALPRHRPGKDEETEK
jgi:hypothetical protein